LCEKYYLYHRKRCAHSVIFPALKSPARFGNLLHMKAIRVSKVGGPESLVLTEVAMPAPGSGEARVKVSYAGVNFIDVYHRTGRYPLAIPFTPGSEASGVVDAVGEGVTEIKVGDRVAYAMQIGAYAEYAIVPAWKLVPIPQHVSDRNVAASMLQGMTAHFLVTACNPVLNKDIVLIHAAAGGVGLLLVQMAKMRGARIIATVGSDEKVKLAKAAGADDVINYTKQDFVAEVKRLTNGIGVHAVYDSVGKATFEKGLDCLRPRGHMVLFGGASGPVAPIDPLTLTAKGSLFLTRPSLRDYAASREELLERAGEVLRLISEDKLMLRIDREYPLSDAAHAHRDLESRKTSGKLLLKP
jgi:NADPH:quinone reductase